MKVLFLAAEATPYIKVGGLGDVAGSLPQALRSLGCDVRLMIPRYGSIDPYQHNLELAVPSFDVPMDWRHENCQLWSNQEQNTYLIENHYFFGSRSQAYGEQDDPERFVLFCRAALQACRCLNWKPDVIHAHDWHSAAAIRIDWASQNRAGLVFTIHNIAHQGIVRPKYWPLLGVYDTDSTLNFMDQAIWAADVVTTVSPTYAKEIQTSEYGFGLEGKLRQKSHRLVGILNGLDLDEFNPTTDDVIAQNYYPTDIRGKMFCKRDLQGLFGLPQQADVPVIALVSRLDDQKGIQLVLDSLPYLLRRTNAQFVFLGSGHKPYEQAFRRWTAEAPHRVANYIGFNSGLAKKVYAGSDMFLMPSQFEPCGLSQMIAMRYGSIPIARYTGGLADTITDRSYPNSTGYHFGDYTASELTKATVRAFEDYWHYDSWKGLVYRAMTRDFSWDRSAEQYYKAYEFSSAMAQR